MTRRNHLGKIFCLDKHHDAISIRDSQEMTCYSGTPGDLFLFINNSFELVELFDLGRQVTSRWTTENFTYYFKGIPASNK